MSTVHEIGKKLHIVNSTEKVHIKFKKKITHTSLSKKIVLKLL